MKEKETYELDKMLKNMKPSELSEYYKTNGEYMANAKKTFTRILKYMGKNKLFLILVFLMLILSTVCNLLASYCLKPILNDIAASINAGTFMNEGIKTHC